MWSASPDAWADDDREAVERAKSDRDAFALLYRRHYHMLATHVYRRIGDVHASEDIVSEVFMTALRMLPRFRYRGVPVRFWLLRIATNTVNRWARRQRRRWWRSMPTEALDRPDPRVSSAVSPVDVEHAQRALRSIAPRYQAVLSLHYLDGLPIKDIAVVLGCREGTVKSRLARAREALRAELSERR